jgi:hypothetical protein
LINEKEGPPAEKRGFEFEEDELKLSCKNTNARNTVEERPFYSEI